MRDFIVRLSSHGDATRREIMRHCRPARSRIPGNGATSKGLPAQRQTTPGPNAKTEPAHRQKTHTTSSPGQQANGKTTNAYRRNCRPAKGKQQTYRAWTTNRDPRFDRFLAHEPATKANVNQRPSQQIEFAAILPSRRTLGH